MTDIIKDYEQKSSGKKMMTYLRSHKSFEQENVALFREELTDLGKTDPTLIAFGNDVYSILNRNFKDEFKILKVPHYANYSSKETYRDQVNNIVNHSNL